MRLASAKSRQGGIALLLVLWMLVLLTIIAISLTVTQRTETTLTGNQIASARFRAQAEAAIHYAGLNLLATATLDEDDEGLWVPDGSVHTWSFAGAELEIRLYDEASLIDLNTADRDLLAALLAAVGFEEGERDALVDALLDWRDPDDLHLINGAEDPDYADAGRPYGAKDGSFDSLEELRQVLGFGPTLYAALAPALSVSSKRPRPQATYAPPLVQAALEGLSLEEVEQRIEEEAAAPTEETVDKTQRGGPLYRIRVRARTDDGGQQAMEALVNIQRGSTASVAVQWRRYALSAAAE